MNLLTISMVVLFVMVISSLLTRAALGFALARNIIDVPNHRSSHSIPTPRGGGYSFVLVFLAAASVLGALRLLQPQETLAMLAGVAIAIVGGWDDRTSLPIRIRLSIHFAAAAVAVLSLVEFRTLRIGLGGTVLGLAAAVLIWLALVWLINLVNFMDGIDGLAGAEAVTVASVCCGISIAAHGINAAAILYAVLAASASGFLIWNWHPAKIFMGDVGSGFLGFCFGGLTLLAVAKHTLSAYVPLILLGVFIVDASFTLARRIFRRERWYAPHRAHAYQHLARQFGHERTTLLIAGVNLLWLAPWAALAQWHPAYSLLCLVTAWAPLVVGAQLLRAGDATSPWAILEEMSHSDTSASRSGTFTSRVPGTAKLARVWASTLIRVYRMMEHNGFVAKHVVLTILNFGCVYLALLTRFDGNIPGPWLKPLPEVALIWCILQGTVLLLFRASRSHWRFTSAEEIPRLSGVAVLASLTGAIGVALLSREYGFARPEPRSIYLLDAFYSVFVLAAIRLASRNLFAQARHWSRESERTRVIIYGADESGVGILSELRRHCLDYRAVGFLDDRPEAQGVTVSGLRVLGRESDLHRLATKHRVDQIIVPSHPLSLERERSLMQICLEEKLNFRIVTTISEDMVLRRPRMTAELVIEDLLGRKPVQLDTSQIAEKLSGQVIMVTGAAGSIGSELCRQIARFEPRAIIGYEINETALFYMERQMEEMFPSIVFVPCIGSVQNRARLNDVLSTYRPETVYHAAAYKHVPLMEQHIFEAIENNIFGTESLLRACEEHGVRSFVMISTDKAARPTSLMGVSKRVAEMLVRASSSPELTCVSTRFGNVLGSNGSVIPIFREQIAKGGPVKVTHPAMVRFFMTIPEAAQLVLQASCLGSANEIFVLDMGAPVKIVDLAERMIRLAGLVPGKDIDIEFTGMRPGEKLYEELSNSDEELLPTAHRSVSVFRSERNISGDALDCELENLKLALAQRSTRDALSVLERLVPDYTSSREIQTLGAQSVELPQHVLHVA